MSITPNIYIIGSQCTGKTTLASALCDGFDRNTGVDDEGKPALITEVARSVLERHHFARHDIRNSAERALELQRLILEAQHVSETAWLRERAWFVSDRSAVDPIIYARKYASREAADALCDSDKWRGMSGRMAKSAVILCEAPVHWLVDDGVRLMPLDEDEWLQIHNEFCHVLEQYGIEYYVLPGSMADMGERIRFVLTKWEDKRNQLNSGGHGP
ncbi:AAA domain-containing protein [Poronia punctata]|nr:AAA domain-containing protein [Poronia punctata]